MLVYEAEGWDLLDDCLEEIFADPVGGRRVLLFNDIPLLVDRSSTVLRVSQMYYAMCGARNVLRGKGGG